MTSRLSRSYQVCFVLFILVCFLFSCQKEMQIGPQRTFRRPNHETLLYFDLSVDSVPVQAGVELSNLAKNYGWQGLILPFGVNSVEPNAELLLTDGSYQSKTFVNYFFSTHNIGVHRIKVEPQVAPEPERYAIDNLSIGIYFSRDGVQRKFIYINRPWSHMNLSALQSFSRSEFDLVAIALPNEAQEQIVRDRKFAIPDPIYSAGKTHYFAAIDSTKQLSSVEIGYSVPPTSGQKYFLEYGLKIFLVLLIPIAKLVLISPQETRNPRLRFWGILIFCALEGAIIFFVILIAQQIGIKSESKLLFDSLIAVIGVISTVLVLIVQRKTKV